MDQAVVLRELKANLGLPWEKLAQRLGLTKRRILGLVGLLDLPDEIKEEIRQKKLTEKHGRALRQLLYHNDTVIQNFWIWGNLFHPIRSYSQIYNDHLLLKDERAKNLFKGIIEK